MFSNNKLLAILLLISSLFGYLEWGQSNSEFIFQTEINILLKIFTNPASVVHPFVIIPLLGQLLLIVTIFQKKPSKILTIIAIAGIGILLLFMLFVGILAANFKIIVSTLPFLVLSFFTLRLQFKN